MKSKALLEDLRTKSAAELNEDLVAAKNSDRARSTGLRLADL